MNHTDSASESIDIREMELADLPAVFNLGRRLFTAEKWPTLYRSWDEHELVQLYRSDRDYCLVAAQKRRVVGFALGTVMEKYRNPWRYGWLLWLGVHPRYKRQGIASRLVNRLTDLFIDHEVRIMLVDTDEKNGDALAFFGKHGFGDDFRHVYLSRNLDEHPKALERKAERELRSRIGQDLEALAGETGGLVGSEAESP